MAVNVATYLAQLNDQKGKLERWETDIFQLYHAGVSYQNIADFLKLNGAESTKMEVYRFIHRKKRRHLLTGNPVMPVEHESVDRNIPSASEIPVESPPIQQSEHQKKQGRPKFKFREGMDKEKIKW